MQTGTFRAKTGLSALYRLQECPRVDTHIHLVIALTFSYKVQSIFLIVQGSSLFYEKVKEKHFSIH